MSTQHHDDQHHDVQHQHENQRREAELRHGAEHVHEAAVHHGHEAHLTPHEMTRHSHEHETHVAPHVLDHSVPNVEDGGPRVFGHREIAKLAYEYWVERGSPFGSPDEDWFRAVKDLRIRALA